MGVRAGPRHLRYPLAASVGTVLLLLAPAVFLGLPAAADQYQLLADPGPAAVSSGGSTWEWWQSSCDELGPGYVSYDSSAETVLVSFTAYDNECSPGQILLLSGPGLSTQEWLDPGCNPSAQSEVPGSANVLVLCGSAGGEWRILIVNTTSERTESTLDLPGASFYDYALAVDDRSNVVYCIAEPDNTTEPAHLIGVGIGDGRVASNVTIASKGDPSGTALAPAVQPGTVFWLDPTSATLEVLNASTGSVGSRYTSPYGAGISFSTDLEDGRAFVGAYDATSVLRAADLSLVTTLPIPGTLHIELDHARGEAYVEDVSAVGVVRLSDWSSLGSIKGAFGVDAETYVPATDRFVGITPYAVSEAETIETINITRFNVREPGFSAVPVAGSDLPYLVALGFGAAGVTLLVASRKAVRLVRAAREAEWNRRFDAWLRQEPDAPRDAPEAPRRR